MKNILFLFCLILLSEICTAQDPEFTQNNSNALYLNPAFAGAFINPVFTASYRNQWPKLIGNYKSGMISYNQYIPKIYGGIGGYYLIDDAAGSIITQLVKVIYSPNIQIGKEIMIKPALSFGYTNKHINWDKLTFGDLIDPRYGFVYQTAEVQPRSNKSFFDFSVGGLVYSRYLYGGFAVEHVNRPDETFINILNTYGVPMDAKLPIKYTLHAGATIPLSDSSSKFSISPNVFYLKQGYFEQKVLQVTMKINFLLIGMGYRNMDSYVFSLGVQNNFFRIAYSYDLTISKLANATTGSHEVFVSYLLERKKKIDKPALKMIAF